MTILGKHTVAETTALGKDLDYQFEQINKAYKAIDPSWIQSHPAEYEKLTKDWTSARKKWSADSLGAKSSMAIKMGAAGIMVSPSIVPAEDEWILLLSNTAQGGMNGDDSFYGVNAKIQEIRNVKTDLSTNRPNQAETGGTDWDFLGFKKVDGAIKTGENKVNETIKSNKGLFIAGGVGLVIGGVVLGKVYL